MSSSEHIRRLQLPAPRMAVSQLPTNGGITISRDSDAHARHFSSRGDINEAYNEDSGGDGDNMTSYYKRHLTSRKRTAMSSPRAYAGMRATPPPTPSRGTLAFLLYSDEETEVMRQLLKKANSNGKYTST